ncbi:MAG: hypothetical protein M3Y82_00270 [Verrucomicrobiota bacterium]|nr:hypothetical protein [Verrucomicrobiota bacterium]
MLSRLTFFLIAAFWLTMTFFLWRSEFSGRQEIGAPVPLAQVWQKVLTAPDNSTLEILHHGKKIGYCRWSANVGEDLPAAGKISSDNYEPEGMVKKLSSYMLNLEGNVMLSSNNLRFDVNLKLSTNQAWQEFSARGSIRPRSWEIRSIATNENVRLAVDDEDGRWEKNISFSELKNPQALIQELGGPLAWILAANLGLNSQTNALSHLSLALKWEARHDWMKFGHSKVRVFRLEARLLDRYKISVFVSRVGEILWVQLPDEIIFSNDAFTHFQ